MVKLFSKTSNLCDHNSSTSQTDRQTTCDRNTALGTKVHRAVKTRTLGLSGAWRKNFDNKFSRFAIHDRDRQTDSDRHLSTAYKLTYHSYAICMASRAVDP